MISVHRPRCFRLTDGSVKILGRSKWRSFKVPSGQDDRSSEMVTIARRRMPWNVDQDAKDQKVGLKLTVLWFLLKRIFTVTHKRAFFGGWEEKYRRGSFFTCTGSSDYSYLSAWTMLQWLEKGRTETHVVISAERYRHARNGRQRWIIRQFTLKQYKTELFQKLTTTGEPDKNKKKENDASGKITPWSCDMKGFAEKYVDRHCDRAIVYMICGHRVVRDFIRDRRNNHITAQASCHLEWSGSVSVLEMGDVLVCVFSKFNDDDNDRSSSCLSLYTRPWLAVSARVRGLWPLPCRASTFASCKKQLSWYDYASLAPVGMKWALYLYWKWVMC